MKAKKTKNPVTSKPILNKPIDILYWSLIASWQLFWGGPKVTFLKNQNLGGLQTAKQLSCSS